MKAAGASSAVRGARQTVAAITHEDALELFSIVGEIEGLAARCAAALSDKPRATLAADLTTIVDAAQRAVQTNWRNAAARLGRVFATVGERGQW